MWCKTVCDVTLHAMWNPNLGNSVGNNNEIIMGNSKSEETCTDSSLCTAHSNHTSRKVGPRSPDGDFDVI